MLVSNDKWVNYADENMKLGIGFLTGGIQLLFLLSKNTF